MHMPPAVVEKDFWVCWMLGRLFASDILKSKILFKGGTSLSKVFRVIERFSEDIDLILDWKEVTREDPGAKRSRTGQDAFNKAIQRQSQVYLRERFLPEVQHLIEGVCTASIGDNPEVIKIRYPAAFSAERLRPDILLEIGPLALWVPNAEYEITAYAAEAFPALFERPVCRVKAVRAERTFWEKVTILHHESHRPETSTQPKGYSRHYYDVARMAKSDIKAVAFRELGLLQSVVAFKDKFHPRGWARYDLAVPGTLKLVPPDHVRRVLEKDYADMRFMIYGSIPPFSALMDSIRELETEINRL